MTKLIFKIGSLFILFCEATACSPVEPIASPKFDGRYIGTRESNSAETCGIEKEKGRTSATIKNGEITMPLFGSTTVLEGTVDASGVARASGMWQSQQTSHFPSMTTFTGKLHNKDLEGQASNFKCLTKVQLHKIEPQLLPRHQAPLQQRESPTKKTKAIKKGK